MLVRDSIDGSALDFGASRTLQQPGDQFWRVKASLEQRTLRGGVSRRRHVSLHFYAHKRATGRAEECKTCRLGSRYIRCPRVRASYLLDILEDPACNGGCISERTRSFLAR